MNDRSTRIAGAGLAALAVAMGIGRFAFTPILPMMQQDAGLDIAQGGALASANYFGYLVGALTAATLRLAPANAIRVGLLAVGLSTLAMGVTHHSIAWLLLRFVAGVASAWVLVFAAAWCLERLQQEAPLERRAVLSATVFAGVGIGIAFAGAVCLALLVAHASSASAWLALGAAALVVSAAIWRGFADDTTAPPSRIASPQRWNAEFTRMTLCYGAFGFGYIIPATFLPAMARDAFTDPAIYGWSWPVFGAAAAASTFIAAALRRRISDRAMWILGHVAMAAGVAMPIFVRTLSGIIVSALLVGGTFMVVTMAGMQEARRVAGARVRTLIAAMTSAFALGQIAGPLAVGVLAPRGGFDVPLALSAAILVASALALLAPSHAKEIP
jgi:MFS family permease